MRNIFFLIVSFIFVLRSAFAADDAQLQNDLQYYRQLTLAVRKEASFKIALPDGSETAFSYELDFADPIYATPRWSNLVVDSRNPSQFYRTFYDRIYLKDGSKINIGEDFVPLTCIFIKGQDNRYSGNQSPLFPKIILKVYLVANDYSCTGPINPGWPDNGGKEEAWDTYINYNVKDPTIMLPVDSEFRYRWNEFKAILVK